MILASDQLSAQSFTKAWPSASADFGAQPVLVAAVALRFPLRAILIWFGVTRDMGSVMDPFPRTIGGQVDRSRRGSRSGRGRHGASSGDGDRPDRYDHGPDGGYEYGPDGAAGPRQPGSPLPPAGQSGYAQPGQYAGPGQYRAAPGYENAQYGHPAQGPQGHYPGGPQAQYPGSAQGQYPGAAQGQYPGGAQYPGTAQGQYRGGAQYPGTAQGQYPGPPQQGPGQPGQYQGPGQHQNQYGHPAQGGYPSASQYGYPAQGQYPAVGQYPGAGRYPAPGDYLTPGQYVPEAQGQAHYGYPPDQYQAEGQYGDEAQGQYQAGGQYSYPAQGQYQAQAHGYPPQGQGHYRYPAQGEQDLGQYSYPVQGQSQAAGPYGYPDQYGYAAQEQYQGTDSYGYGQQAQYADRGDEFIAQPPGDWVGPDGRPAFEGTPAPTGPLRSADLGAEVEVEAEPEPAGITASTTARPYGQILIFTLLDDKAADFDALAEETAEQVRTSEPGTLVYVIHLVPNAPMQRIFYEIYRDRAAFETHEDQSYMKRFVAERRSCVLATNIIELRVKYAKVAPLVDTRQADEGPLSVTQASRPQLPPGQGPVPLVAPGQARATAAAQSAGTRQPVSGPRHGRA